MAKSGWLRGLVNEAHRNGRIDDLKRQELLTILDDLAETEAGTHKGNLNLRRKWRNL